MRIESDLSGYSPSKMYSSVQDTIQQFSKTHEYLYFCINEISHIFTLRKQEEEKKCIAKIFSTFNKIYELSHVMFEGELLKLNNLLFFVTGGIGSRQAINKRRSPDMGHMTEEEYRVKKAVFDFFKEIEEKRKLDDHQVGLMDDYRLQELALKNEHEFETKVMKCMQAIHRLDKSALELMFEPRVIVEVCTRSYSDMLEGSIELERRINQTIENLEGAKQETKRGYEGVTHLLSELASIQIEEVTEDKMNIEKDLNTVGVEELNEKTQMKNIEFAEEQLLRTIDKSNRNLAKIVISSYKKHYQGSLTSNSTMTQLSTDDIDCNIERIESLELMIKQKDEEMKNRINEISLKSRDKIVFAELRAQKAEEKLLEMNIQLVEVNTKAAIAAEELSRNNTLVAKINKDLNKLKSDNDNLLSDNMRREEKLIACIGLLTKMKKVLQASQEDPSVISHLNTAVKGLGVALKTIEEIIQGSLIPNRGIEVAATDLSKVEFIAVTDFIKRFEKVVQTSSVAAQTINPGYIDEMIQAKPERQTFSGGPIPIKQKNIIEIMSGIWLDSNTEAISRIDLIMEPLSILAVPKKISSSKFEKKSKQRKSLSNMVKNKQSISSYNKGASTRTIPNPASTSNLKKIERKQPVLIGAENVAKNSTVDQMTSPKSIRFFIEDEKSKSNQVLSEVDKKVDLKDVEVDQEECSSLTLNPNTEDLHEFDNFEASHSQTIDSKQIMKRIDSSTQTYAQRKERSSSLKDNMNLKDSSTSPIYNSKTQQKEKEPIKVAQRMLEIYQIAGIFVPMRAYLDLTTNDESTQTEIDKSKFSVRKSSLPKIERSQLDSIDENKATLESLIDASRNAKHNNSSTTGNSMININSNTLRENRLETVDEDTILTDYRKKKNHITLKGLMKKNVEILQNSNPVDRGFEGNLVLIESIQNEPLYSKSK